jgi:cyclic pyranopterin phosphate synthase
MAGFTGKIGFISALSHIFCASCNRIRLTSSGIIKPCLSSDISVDIKKIIRDGGGDAELQNGIRDAVMRKPLRHSFNDYYENNDDNSIHKTKNMYKIGG